MRSGTFLLLILLAPPILAARAEDGAQPTCRKNILVYFDASGSMSEQRQGQTLRELMLNFLSQALASNDLLEFSDTLTVKRFIDRPEVMPGTQPQTTISAENRQALLEKVRAGIVVPPKKERSNDTDYINLVSDVEAELRSFPAELALTNYVLIFSDFFYNPLHGNQDKWQRQQSELSTRLGALKDTFQEKHAKLIIVYQQNSGVDGVEVIKQFTDQSYAKRIFDVQDIPKLVSQVAHELQQSVVLAPGGSRFQYTGQGLTLELKLANPNCAALRVTQVRTEAIGGPNSDMPPLAAETVFSKDFDLKPGDNDPFTIPLKNVPRLQDLEGKYLHHDYDVKVSILSGAEKVDELLKIPFEDDAFSEKLAFTYQAVRLHHIISRFDRLFIRLVPEGSLIKDRRLNVEADAHNYQLHLVDPEDGSRKVTASNTLQNQDNLFAFALKQSNSEADSKD
ncbi:MAG: hypothetical protein ABIP96_03350, partial [Patescibacteria group bacterium]